jgi:hypothetical protein
LALPTSPIQYAIQFPSGENCGDFPFATIFLSGPPSGGSKLIALDSLRELGETEIENLHRVIVVHHDVGGFQIAVNNPGGMGLSQRIGDLDRMLEHVAEAKTPAADPLMERLAL